LHPIGDILFGVVVGSNQWRENNANAKRQNDHKANHTQWLPEDITENRYMLKRFL
jgi:hypothetical protein